MMTTMMILANGVRSATQTPAGRGVLTRSYRLAPAASRARRYSRRGAIELGPLRSVGEYSAACSV